ncbi:MAG: phosphate ABC transporter permease PstA [Alphaproteobacteria bacterium]
MSNDEPNKVAGGMLGPAGQKRLKRRYGAEQRFRVYGILAIAVAVAFLVLLIGNVVVRGASAFFQTQIRLDVTFDGAVLDPEGKATPQDLAKADYAALIRSALMKRFPEVAARRDLKELTALVSAGAKYELRALVLADPAVIGTTQSEWLLASADVDMLSKGRVSVTAPADERRLTDNQLQWFQVLKAAGDVRTPFNWRFFTSGDSREPELAGVGGAIVGSFYLILVTLLLAFPVAVMAAVYLEEFAPKNAWTDLIEVNINNLAAVPSIVFGLLGLAVFIGFFDMARSAPLVGGTVLALMTLPTIIIATRSALKAVPPWIRDAARGMGASSVQVVAHHVLPLAMPGILTGTIIGLSRALGETAPLLMIGMVAFIVDIPKSPLDPASALPVQIYLWAGAAERAFSERTAAAVIVLLLFLVTMNGLAVFMRKKFERRW